MAIRSRNVVCYSILLILVSVESLKSDDFDDFYAIYKNESRQVSDKLRNIKGAYRMKTIIRNNSTKTNESNMDTGEFAVSGSFGKATLHFEKSFKGKDYSTDYVHCKTKDYFYSLSKRKDDTKYMFDDLGFYTSSNKLAAVNYDTQFGHFIESPYRFLNIDIADMIVGKALSKPIVEKTVKDGKNILRIRSHVKLNPALFYEFEFDQDSLCRLIRASHFADDKMLFQFLIQYDSFKLDSVIPQKVIYERPDRVNEYYFDQVEFVSTPESEFLPSFYGLPNIQGSSRSFSFYMICILAFLFLALLIRHYFSHGSRPLYQKI